MKFNYRKTTVCASSAFPDRKFVLHPIIPPSLIYKDKHIRYEALIDSGADYNIFPTALGEILGINVKSGKTDQILGISGVAFNVYFHQIVIEIGGWKTQTLVGFADHVNQSQGILGQNGFFDLYKVKFSYKQEEIEIIPCS